MISFFRLCLNANCNTAMNIVIMNGEKFSFSALMDELNHDFVVVGISKFAINYSDVNEFF